MGGGIFALKDLGYIQISNFGDSADKEHVGRFNVSVNDIAVMKGL